MQATIERREDHAQHVPKLQAGLLFVTAFGAGLCPYALLTSSLPLWLVQVILIAVAFVYANRARQNYAGTAPSSTELSLAWLGRCSGGAAAGVIGIALVYPLGWIRSFFHSDGSTGVGGWPVYTATGIVIFLTLATAYEYAEGTVGALYPEGPGQRSTYFLLSKQATVRQGLAIRVPVVAVALALMVAAALVDALATYRTFVTIAANLAMVAAGGDYIEVKRFDTLQGPSDAVAAAVKTLLEAAHFRVIPRPRTGNDEADAAISILDFCAIRSDRAMAGRIRSGTGPTGMDTAFEAASLEPAVWVLQGELQQQNPTLRLTPLLLVLGDDDKVAADTPPGPTAGSSVKIVSLPSERQLQAMIDEHNHQPLTELAERLFGAPAAVTGGAA